MKSPADTSNATGPANSWELCNNSAIRRASRRLGQLYADVLAPSGLRATQFGLLTQIRTLGEPTLRTLADALVMDISALDHTLKPLILDGIVALAPDPQDRRVRRAHLTRKGLAAHARGVELWKEAQSRFDAQFGKEESAALRRTLDLIASDEFAAGFTAQKIAVPKK